MATVRAAQLLVNSVLPEHLRDYNRPLDAKGLNAPLLAIAQESPELFTEVADKLSRIGREASYFQGETLRLSDFKPVIDKSRILAAMNKELAVLRKRYAHDPEAFADERAALWTKYSDLMRGETMREAMRRGNNLGYSVVSGARGKPAQIQAMITSPGVYADQNDRTVPLFVRHSFSEGLRPAEFLAGTYGARKAVISTKRATAMGGAMGKMMVQATSPLIVTEQDCKVDNGLDFDVSSRWTRNRVLARPAGGFEAGTVLTRDVLHKLRQNGDISSVIVRSPMTCQAAQGICAKCAGADPRGNLYSLGEAIGDTSSNALSEPWAQGALNVKHCLAEGTEVLMADYTTKAIEHLVVGDLVMGADLRGRMLPTQVTHTWDQGVLPVEQRLYRLGQTSQVVSLISTSEHKVLSNRKTYGLKLGSQNANVELLPAGYPHKNLAAVMPVENLTPGRSEPWAVFLGAFLGDGIRWDDRIEAPPRFSCADPAEVKDLNCMLRPLNVELRKRKRSHDWVVVMLGDPLDDFRDGISGRVVSAVRSPVRRKLLEWGMQRKYAHEKRIPREAWGWDQASVAALVAGYIATDGSVGLTADGHVFCSFGSVSRGLMEDLRDLLWQRLCVFGGAVNSGRKAGTGNYTHDFWTFSVNRQDQLRRLATLTSHLIPGVKGARFTKVMSEFIGEDRNPDWFYRAKRIDTQALGLRHCYDITVDNDAHLFVLANGLIVSNSGGQASGKREYAGFDVMQRFVNSPEQFEDRAVVAEEDGKVTAVEAAPQGGHYIVLNGARKHYVFPDYPISVKVGDTVEAGQQMAEGLIDPEDVVRLRGLGEGRRYYAERLKKIMDDSGHTTDPRNAEPLARAALDHIRIPDPDGYEEGTMPDDVISYNAFRRGYKPPEDTEEVDPREAIGKHLQADALHYTIGTRVTPSIAERLASRNFGKIKVSSQPPEFEAAVPRLMAATHNQRDWLAGQYTTYLKRQLADSALRGDDTRLSGSSHFAPALAVGENFAKDIRSTGTF